MNNYWDEFEYSKLKLLLHKEKVDSILLVKNGEKLYDSIYPISVELHLTDYCNLKCEWCTDRELRKNGATLELNKVKQFLAEMGKNRIGVTIEGGGEPTMHPYFHDIVEYGMECGVDLGLITNGTQDISDIASYFKWIRVSLDASDREQYIREKGRDCWSQVLLNTEKMCLCRDPKSTFVGIGYVLTTRNSKNLVNVIDALDRIGVDYIYIRPVEEAPSITPTIKELLDLRKKLADITVNKRIKYLLTIQDRIVAKNAGLPCFAHSLTSIIHANGDVALCEKRRNSEIILGNLYDNTFDEIWNSERHAEISQELLNAKCQDVCSACRVTGFNVMLDQLEHVHTKRFI